MASKRKNNSKKTPAKAPAAKSGADTSAESSTEASEETSTDMAEAAKVPEATQADAPQQLFKIQRVYIKDVSYESPQAPKVFVQNTQWQQA